MSDFTIGKRRVRMKMDSPIAPMLKLLASNGSIEEAVRHSVKNMHVPGFDYICLHRSDQLTVKLYFFDQNVNDMLEVVAPHNHRYDFHTYCLRGSMTDTEFSPTYKGDPRGVSFVLSDYSSRMVHRGHDAGFEPIGPVTLRETCKTMVDTCTSGLTHKYSDIHTISVREEGTVLCLIQSKDVVVGDNKTSTFFPPDFDIEALNAEVRSPELYQKFSVSEIRHRLADIGLVMPLWVQ